MGEEHYEDHDPAYESAPEKGGGSGKTILIIALCAMGGLFCLCVPIIAAIAIPNLIEARKHGNEAAAIGSLRTLASAQAIYREADKDGNGEFDYGALENLGAANLIDPVLAGGTKQGYIFRCAPGSEAQYTWWAVAEPAVAGSTGDRHFFINHTGVVYVSDSPMTINEGSAEPPANATPLGKR